MERRNEDERERVRSGPLAPEGADSGTNDEEIRRRAYEIYESRGGAPGSDMDDWLTAERELRERRSGSGMNTGAGAPMSAGSEPGSDSGMSDRAGPEGGRGAGARRGPRTRSSSTQRSGGREP